MSFFDVRQYMTPDDMCDLGSWTLCTSIRYSLIPSLKFGRAPDPRRILLLSDEENVLEGAEIAARVCESRMGNDGIDKDVLLAYLRTVPEDNIYWFDVMHRDHLNLAIPLDNSPRVRFSERSTYYAYLQHQWLLKHRDGSVEFEWYLQRLSQVVSAYVNSENTGPAWGGVQGYQWDPMRQKPPLEMGDQPWSCPHPLQITRNQLLFPTG